MTVDTPTRSQLLERRKQLLAEVTDINQQLNHMDNMEKPYVASVSSYSGGGEMAFKTEAQARKKLDEYYGKDYYRNGLNYGVYLYRHNPDKTKTLIEVREKSQSLDFFLPQTFKKQLDPSKTIIIKRR